jgi:hypothetical protein
MLMSELKYCPLLCITELNSYCLYENCAWYQTNNSRCSIFVIANVLVKELVKLNEGLKE